MISCSSAKCLLHYNMHADFIQVLEKWTIHGIENKDFKAYKSHGMLTPWVTHRSFYWVMFICSTCMAKNDKCWTLRANFSTRFFHTSHTDKHHLLLLLYTTFSDLDLFKIAEGQKISGKQYPLDLISGTLFNWPCNITMKQLKLNLLCKFSMGFIQGK